MDVKSGCLGLVGLVIVLAHGASVQAEQFTTPNGTVIDRTFIGSSRPHQNIAVCVDERVAKLSDVKNFAANYLYDLVYNIVDIDTVPPAELDDYTLVYIGSDPSTGIAPSCLTKQARLLEFAQSDAKDIEKPIAGRPKGLPPLGPPLASTSYHLADNSDELAFITSICDVDIAGADECRTLSVPAVFALDGWGLEWDFRQQSGS